MNVEYRGEAARRRGSDELQPVVVHLADHLFGALLRRAEIIAPCTVDASHAGIQDVRQEQVLAVALERLHLAENRVYAPDQGVVPSRDSIENILRRPSLRLADALHGPAALCNCRNGFLGKEVQAHSAAGPRRGVVVRHVVVCALLVLLFNVLQHRQRRLVAYVSERGDGASAPVHDAGVPVCLLDALALPLRDPNGLGIVGRYLYQLRHRLLGLQVAEREHRILDGVAVN